MDTVFVSIYFFEEYQGQISQDIYTKIYTYLFIYLFWFLGPHLQHVEVSRPGVESELQLPACTTATATQDPSHICDLHHSPQQGQGSNLRPHEY